MHEKVVFLSSHKLHRERGLFTNECSHISSGLEGNSLIPEARRENAKLDEFHSSGKFSEQLCCPSTKSDSGR